MLGLGKLAPARRSSFAAPDFACRHGRQRSRRPYAQRRAKRWPNSIPCSAPASSSGPALPDGARVARSDRRSRAAFRNRRRRGRSRHGICRRATRPSPHSASRPMNSPPMAFQRFISASPKITRYPRPPSNRPAWASRWALAERVQRRGHRASRLVAAGRSRAPPRNARAGTDDHRCGRRCARGRRP